MPILFLQQSAVVYAKCRVLTENAAVSNLQGVPAEARRACSGSHVQIAGVDHLLSITGEAMDRDARPRGTRS